MQVGKDYEADANDVFPFEFELGSALPPSGDSKLFSTLYFLRVTVFYGVQQSVSLAKGITLIESVCLDALGAEFLAADSRRIKNRLGLCFCAGGQVEFDFGVSRRAFLAGEHIEIRGGRARRHHLGLQAASGTTRVVAWTRPSPCSSGSSSWRAGRTAR